MNPVIPSAKMNGFSGVKSNLPIDFSMYDENLHYVLYITDDPTSEHRLIMELNNNSGQTISFDALSGVVDEQNCNFELRFRNGTLSDKTLKILRKDSNDPEISQLSVLSKDDQNQWEIGLDEGSTGASAYISLYFRSTRAEPLTLASEGALILRLQNISADAGSGARGTRIEFIPHQIRFSDDNSLVTGTREQHVFITNHSGQKWIPLHVGFFRSDRILNEAKDQRLIVRITNISRDKTITLNPSTFDSPTFIGEFDYDVDWGLGTKSEVGAIRIAATNGWQAENHDQLLKIWHPLPPELKPDGYIEFELNNITTSGSSGFTNLYLYYHHIPGYWDGQFVLTLEKTALLFSGNNVGIGTPDPRIRLALGDNDTGIDQNGDGRLTFFTNGVERARIDEYGNVGMGTARPAGSLDLHRTGTDKRQSEAVSGAFPYGTEKADLVLAHEISANYSLNGQTAALIDFRAIYTAGNGVFEWSTAQILGVSDLNYKGYAGGLAFLTSPGGSDNPSSRNPNEVRNNGSAPITRMVIDAKGNIGIGTTSPQARLDVAQPYGLAIKVEPTPGTSVHVGRNEVNSLEFSYALGQAINSTASLSFNMDSNNDDTDRYIDFRVDGAGFGGGSSIMRLLENGTVGIGTTSPNAKLNILNSEQDANGNTLILGSTDKSNLRLGYHTDYSWIQSHGSKPLAINAIGNNVGFGTTSPIAKVDIQAVGRTDPNNHPKAVNGLYVTGNFDADKNGVEFRHTNGSQGIGFGYNSIYATGSNVDQPLNLLPKGNVGIGTNNPTKGKLHVEGDLYCKGTLFVEGGLNYYWGPDGKWKNLQNRADNWAGSYDGRGPSDLRLKKDLKPITQALAKTLQLRGTYFQWGERGLQYFIRDIEKTISAGPGASREADQKVWDAERKKRVERLAGNQIGLIAQEVESVVPEAVHADEEGNKFLDYGHLTALLVEAIKEQNVLMEALNARLNALEKV